MRGSLLVLAVDILFQVLLLFRRRFPLLICLNIFVETEFHVRRLLLEIVWTGDFRLLGCQIVALAVVARYFAGTNFADRGDNVALLSLVRAQD